jgi:hypothetical protein
MTALCRKPLGSSESGTLRASLDVMRGEVESMGKAHQGIAGQMKSELEEPLAAFAGGMKERRKIVQAGIEKLFKTKLQQTQAVNKVGLRDWKTVHVILTLDKARDRYEQDCLKIKGYLAQGHMVMGQEERKNKAKMEKTQIQLASTSNEYEAAVKVLEETTNRWNREWKAACDKFQDLEEERLDFTKSSLWTFANVASTVCVSDDAVGCLPHSYEVLAYHCSHVRKYDWPLRIVRSKKTSALLFETLEQVKKFLSLQSISTSAGETSMRLPQKHPRRMATQSPNSKGPSTRHSVLLHRSHRCLNRTMILTQI